jgi:uncharacterized membrane protein YfcA
MAGLTWLISPSLLVPVIVVLEMTASLLMWHGSAADADGRWLRALVLGNLISVPLGLGVLLFVPQHSLQVLVAIVLLVAAVGLRFVLRATWPDHWRLRGFTGLASGWMNGVAASGGVVAAMLMTAAGLPGARLRATMVFFLLFSDSLMLLLMLAASAWELPIANALFNAHSLTLALWLGLPMAVGIQFGQRRFRRTGAQDFRRFVLNLLTWISGLSLLLVLAR